MKVESILDWLSAEGYDLDDSVFQKGVRLNWSTIKKASSLWETNEELLKAQQERVVCLESEITKYESLVSAAKRRIAKLNAKLAEKELFIADVYVAHPSIEIDIKRQKEKRRYVKRS